MCNIFAFSLQQLLHERASMQRDNYTVLLRSVMNLGDRSRLQNEKDDYLQDEVAFLKK